MGTRTVSDGFPPLEDNKESPHYGWYKMKCLLCGADTYLNPMGPWRSVTGCAKCLRVCAVTGCTEEAKFTLTTRGRTFKTGPLDIQLCARHHKQADAKFGPDGVWRPGDGETYDATITEIR